MKLKILFLSSVAGALLCGVVAMAIPAPYETSLAFTVDQRPRQDAKEYDYDGYYALRATELFGDTLISWFGTPSFVVGVYKDAGITVDPGAIDLAAAVDGFRAKKLSTQNVVIRFSMRDRLAAENVARSAVAAVKAKTAALNQDDKGRALFVVTASDPTIVLAPVSPIHAGIAGLFLGLFAGYAFLVWSETKKPPAATA